MTCLPHTRLEDLPDKLILRVLKELPQQDLLKVGRVSSRLQDLSLDGALWQELCALGPDMTTNEACSMLRNTSGLTHLSVHDRDDVDALLLEASRWCRSLERLELTRCRGSQTYRGISYIPLLKIAHNCHRLRELRFNQTDFRCSRVFKVWADLRGPGEPALEIAVNKLYSEQARFILGVLDGPQAVEEVARQGASALLLVQNHSISLQDDGDSDPSLAGPSTSSGRGGGAPARIRPAPSSSGEDSCRPSEKRLCRHRVLSTEDQEFRTVFVRSPLGSASLVRPVDVDQASCLSSDDDDESAHAVGWESTTAERYDDDDGDVVTGPVPSTSRQQEYRSLFSMSGPMDTPPLLNSWFTSGYIGPVYGVSSAESEEDVMDAAASSRCRYDEREDDCSVCSDLSVHVTDITEEDVLSSLTSSRSLGPLPPATLRRANCLLEPRGHLRVHRDSEGTRVEAPGVVLSRHQPQWTAESDAEEESVGDHVTEGKHQQEPCVRRPLGSDEGDLEPQQHDLS